MDLLQNQTLIVWFRCQLCRGSFQTVTDFVEHKQQWHLAEFQKINSDCVIFEEAIVNNQGHAANEIPAATLVSISDDVNFRFQTEIPARPEPEPELELEQENEVEARHVAASQPISPAATLYTAKKEAEIVQLITYDNSTKNETGSEMTQSKSHDDPDADIIEPLNKIEQQRGLNFHDRSNTETEQRVKLERTFIRSKTASSPRVKNSYVLITRLTPKEIPAASPNGPKSNPSNISNRKRKATKSKSFKCPKAGCSKIFKTLWYQNMHFATHTKSKSNGRQKDRPFHCEHPGCGKSFKRIDGLKSHLETHAEPRDRRAFPCQICSKVCYRLEKHYREVHGNQRPFLCPQPGCMKSFKRKEAVMAHFETHADPRNRATFPCQLCSKTCLKGKRYVRLDKHYRNMHGKERPFSCPQPGCMKSFKRKVAARDHFKTHVDPNDRLLFACKVCKLSYWHLENLRKHCLVVHGAEASTGQT